MSQGSSEKTEKASPKKKRDAREKGEVHKSADLASAMMLFFLFGTLKIGFEGFVLSMQAYVKRSLGTAVAERARNLTGAVAVSAYRDTLFMVLPVILPLFLVAMICAAMVHLIQIGPMFVPSRLKPDFGKISPFQGIKRIFSPTTLVEMSKSVVKIIILGWIIYKYLKNGMGSFPQMIYADVGGAFLQIMSACFSMGVMIGLALVAFAAVDVLYQWWKYEKDLMMTKQEVKEENKQTEGDPQIKGKIRQKQRRMSAMRMMRSIPDADVVVTNPTHFAVALRYKESEDNAPVVIAKGQDYLALRMKEKAAKHSVTIVENKPVARALYASCEVGDEIPPELYQAIADILIYVYRTINAR